MMVTEARNIFLTMGFAALCAAGAAAAQDAPAPQVQVAPTSDPQGPAPPSQGRPSSEPGVVDAIVRWIDDSIDTMRSNLNNARNAFSALGDQTSDAAKSAGGALKDTAEPVVRIPTPAIVTGHKHCTRTAGGGPDCSSATEALCRSKGYSAGTSLHIQSEQKCQAWGWVAGEKPVGRCGTETYVTSAMCR